jgi:hypothetical protein
VCIPFYGSEQRLAYRTGNPAVILNGTLNLQPPDSANN